MAAAVAGVALALAVAVAVAVLKEVLGQVLVEKEELLVDTLAKAKLEI